MILIGPLVKAISSPPIGAPAGEGQEGREVSSRLILRMKYIPLPSPSPPGEGTPLPFARGSSCSRIANRHLIDIPYSYPVQTLLRDRALQTIQPFLERNAVYSRSRFRCWKYEVSNMDHNFMQGVEVVEQILRDTTELTLQGCTG